ncbi:cadherin-like domain-containing protein [Actibacterium sp. 188UL27-1]|uniref:cadherin-like domain-containing protein n=1 Tax=Actibacterium sp. 188UL27-1 TaxID=2786961 RepID=UPI00195A497A|nr:cadherin-like domain-containing protein [Actibacterium sp. 188UL27-1]
MSGKPTNTAPVFESDTVNLGDRIIDGTFGIVASAIHGETDADGDPLKVVKAEDEVCGAVRLSANGNMFFKPEDGFEGEASFTAVISDDKGGMAERTVLFNVTQGDADVSPVGDDAPDPDLDPAPQPDSDPAPESDDLVRWSEEFGNFGTNGQVVTGAGERFLLDENADVGAVVVDGGELIVQNGRDITLSTDWLLVMDGGLF